MIISLSSYVHYAVAQSIDFGRYRHEGSRKSCHWVLLQSPLICRSHQKKISDGIFFKILKHLFSHFPDVPTWPYFEKKDSQVILVKKMPKRLSATKNHDSYKKMSVGNSVPRYRKKREYFWGDTRYIRLDNSFTITLIFL